VTVGVARAAQETGGVPGSWFKWLNSSFSSPGLGGNSDMVRGVTGTAVYAWPALGGIIAIGSMETGQPTLSFSLDGLAWQRVGVPLVYADPASWNRTQEPSVELYGYWALSAEGGDGRFGGTLFTYATYWLPSDENRYFVRRQVDMYSHVGVSCSCPCGSDNAAAAPLSPACCAAPTATYASPSSMVALSTFTLTGTGQAWSTTGAVVPPGGWTLADPVLCYVLTSNTTLPGGGAATSDNTSLVTLQDCATAAGDHIPTLDGECGAVFNGTVMRTQGWLWQTPMAAAAAVATAAAGGRLSTLPSATTFIGTVYRCVITDGTAAASANGSHFATFNDPQCAVPGGGSGMMEVVLGYAYAPLVPGI